VFALRKGPIKKEMGKERKQKKKAGKKPIMVERIYGGNDGGNKQRKNGTEKENDHNGIAR
jgi:hypothetical protein